MFTLKFLDTLLLFVAEASGVLVASIAKQMICYYNNKLI